MPDDRFYPYLLIPKLTPAIWGGDALVTRYGKNGDPNVKMGESWECWDENAVANGPLAGKTLAQLRALLGTQLLGDITPDRIFPILTKIIDARDALSVQVHPDDAYAQRVEHQPNGKTECWYVMHADSGAELVLGWTRDTDRTEYLRRVQDGSLGEILRRVPVREGEAYYLPSGTLHAIGKGIVVFETQQASDLTYRIFDWNRVGPDGKPRALAVDKAADVLDFHQSYAGALEELGYAYEGFRRTALISDPHFIVERVIATETAGTISTRNRPLIVMALQSPLQLRCGDASVGVEPYETALVPAAALGVEITASNGVEAPFMLVTPPDSPGAMERRLHDAGVAQATIDRWLAQFTTPRPPIAA